MTDLLDEVAAAALVRHPDVNVSYSEEGCSGTPNGERRHRRRPAAGLVVPVVHGAERLSLAEIARARADLVGRARDGQAPWPRT